MLSLQDAADPGTQSWILAQASDTSTAVAPRRQHSSGDRRASSMFKSTPARASLSTVPDPVAVSSTQDATGAALEPGAGLDHGPMSRQADFRANVSVRLLAMAQADPCIDPMLLERSQEIWAAVQAVDSVALDSWHYSMLDLEPPGLIAAVCAIFLKLGLAEAAGSGQAGAEGRARQHTWDSARPVPAEEPAAAVMAGGPCVPLEVLWHLLDEVRRRGCEVGGRPMASPAQTCM